MGARLCLEHSDPLPGALEGLIRGPDLTARRCGAPSATPAVTTALAAAAAALLDVRTSFASRAAIRAAKASNSLRYAASRTFSSASSASSAPLISASTSILTYRGVGVSSRARLTNLKN